MRQACHKPLRLLFIASLCALAGLHAPASKAADPQGKPAGKVKDPITQYQEARAAAATGKAPAPPMTEPPLPESDGFPVDVNHYENPLLLFQGERQELPMADEPGPDLLPPLAPYLPEEERPPEEPKPLTPAQLRILELGRKVVYSIVGLRVWDAYGVQLSAGVGAYVTDDGVVLTDAGLVHPEIADKVDYITLTQADGSNHKITGFYVADLASGVALLQSETTEATQPLRLAPDTSFAEERACHVVAVSEKKGLVVADASIQQDGSLTGLGWLNVRGKDSPGAVGSPVLAQDGSIVALVGMQVPLKNWMNFALPCDAAAFELNKKRGTPRPLNQLPKTPRLREVAADPDFLAAFATLQQRRVESAMRKFVQLTRKYPRSAECWALLGLGASYLGAAPEAVNCQRKAVALDPKAGLYWHQLAFAKLRETRGAEAVPETAEDREALQQAVEQRPNDQLAWLLLASRHVRDGDLGQADEALRRVTLLAPGYAQGHYLSAYVRGRLKDYEGAQASIKQSLALNPANAEAWFYQGLLLDRDGNPAEAAKAYRNTVRLRPGHPRAWINLAYAYKKSGQATEARQAFIEHQKRTATPKDVR